MKRSRAKLWIRTGILAVFATLFGLAINRDVVAGVLRWWMAAGIFLTCLPAGYLLSRLVPMEFHPHSMHVTITFDRVYFALIFLLVGTKALAGRLLGVALVADVIMCAILGLMIGRLAGIGLRVREIKRGA